MHRTGGTRGNARIDVQVPGLGRFRLSLGSTRPATIARRKAIVQLLAREFGQTEVLRGLKAGEITWAQLEQAQRAQKLGDGSLGAQIKLRTNLRAAIEQTLPRMGRAEATRERYRVGLSHLVTLGVLRDGTIVQDLLRDDWAGLLDRWEASPATKNAVRASVSRFLTKFLGDKFDPFRRAVLHEDRWPRLKVPPTVRGITPSQFQSLLARVPEHLVPSYVILAATGMRVGEYLSQGIQADEQTHTLHTTGKTGPKVYALAPELWPLVRVAVPCRASRMTKVPARLQDDPRWKKLYKHLRAAGAADGIRVTVHDLRRLYVKCGVDALGEVATQHAVGHETPAMTREYARSRSAALVASAVADSLGLTGVSGVKSGVDPTIDGTRRRVKRPQRRAEAG